MIIEGFFLELRFFPRQASKDRHLSIHFRRLKRQQQESEEGRHQCASPTNASSAPLRQCPSGLRGCSRLFSIIFAPPVLAITLCAFANDFGLYILLTEGPNFMNNVLHKDVATVSESF